MLKCYFALNLYDKTSICKHKLGQRQKHMKRRIGKMVWGVTLVSRIKQQVYVLVGFKTNKCHNKMVVHLPMALAELVKGWGWKSLRPKSSLTKRILVYPKFQLIHDNSFGQ